MMKRIQLISLLIVLGLVACTQPLPEPTKEVIQEQTETVLAEPSPEPEKPENPTEEAQPEPTVLPTVLPTEEPELTETVKPVWSSEPKVIAEGLSWPWELVFLPDGGILLTERPGNLLLIRNGEERIPIKGVTHIGEGGLLGLALHPEFEQKAWLYLYVTYELPGQVLNRVERYVFRDDQLSERIVIVDEISGSSIHDGGRIKFGPDGKLYITTGDAGNPDIAQNLESLNGKILRLNDDGSIPDDNPFGSSVWSTGHRNAQGLAWDSQGRLWSTEHGPSGSETGNDEVNLIEPGKNYGWPLLRGMQTQEGFTAPVIESGRNDTWAPSGAVIVDDVLFFAGLRGAAVYRVPVDGISMDTFEVLYKNEFGRIRNVVVSPEGQLWIMTSNGAGVDQVIALPLQ
jgi:glucose/arabinose dehydrogenase